MIAVDTNILVRVLTNDDPAQARRAVGLIEGEGGILIPKTVVLETEWVLRHAYGIGRETIIEAFQKLFGLPNVRVEDSRSIFLALSWYEKGLDFADAIHLASSARAAGFATFDKTLSKKTKNLDSVEVFKP